MDLQGLGRVFTSKAGVSRTALDDATLELAAGGVHGLLGPNGAGKTTLCRIISTVLLPSTGTAHVFGHHVVQEAQAVRPLLGIVFGGERGLYTRLTARDNLRFWCSMYGIRGKAARRRTDQLLERVGLLERADERVEGFSRGMKQRIHLARGLITDAPLLLLDEPTVGMDPLAAMEFRDMVGDLRDHGTTILLTTHDMSEAEAVCDTLTFINAGRVVVGGSPQDVKARLGDTSLIVVEGVSETLGRQLPGVHMSFDARKAAMEIKAARIDVPGIVARLADCGHTNVSVRPPSVHDA